MSISTITRYFKVNNTVVLYALPISLAIIVIRLMKARRRARTTRLNGPPSRSCLFGVSKDLFEAPDIGVLYEDWENEFGPVYEIPSIIGSKAVVLCDPKAVASLYAKDTFTYHQLTSSKSFIKHFFGLNLLITEGETHKRQRRALSSAFSGAAIRRLTSVFYDSAYMLKSSWDSTFQSNSKDSLVIDVQLWMNHVSLDSIGTGGFSHDFGCLKGRVPAIAAALDSFSTVKPSPLIMISFLLSSFLPILGRIPTKRTRVMRDVSLSTSAIAHELIERAKAEKAADTAEGSVDKSIMGTLIRSESAASSLHMSIDEIMAQNLLILAGYETTAISLTWGLIELARNPEIQEKLRAELAQFSGIDPTYEQLMNGLPYLDAIACETLRVHPPAPDFIRQAVEDDMIPLTNPITDASGQVISSIFIAKGTIIRIPIIFLNRSTTLWGPDAKDFNPGRWLDDSITRHRAAEIQGYRHLLTFADGPRICLGKGFALTEFKAVLSVLIRNFTFEFLDGPSTKIESHRSILTRPKVAGQEGSKVPLVVRRVE